jgi:hypothetical protein
MIFFLGTLEDFQNSFLLANGMPSFWLAYIDKKMKSFWAKHLG